MNRITQYGTAWISIRVRVRVRVHFMLQNLAPLSLPYMCPLPSLLKANIQTVVLVRMSTTAPRIASHSPLVPQQQNTLHTVQLCYATGSHYIQLTSLRFHTATQQPDDAETFSTCWHAKSSLDNTLTQELLSQTKSCLDIGWWKGVQRCTIWPRIVTKNYTDYALLCCNSQLTKVSSQIL